MDKKLIREIFVQYAVEVEGEHGEIWWSIPDEDVGIVVDTIAAQHEQEVADLVAMMATELVCIANVIEGGESFAERDMVHIRELALSSAPQVAMMGDCLKWLDDHHAASHGASRKDAEPYNEERNNQVLDTIAQILSAAPKVWRMQGRTSKYYDLEVVAEDAPDEFRQLLIGRGMFAPWDVMVCPPKGEQPTESEQGEEERDG